MRLTGLAALARCGRTVLRLDTQENAVIEAIVVGSSGLLQRDDTEMMVVGLGVSDLHSEQA